jgi:hypothetical protein
VLKAALIHAPVELSLVHLLHVPFPTLTVLELTGTSRLERLALLGEIDHSVVVARVGARVGVLVVRRSEWVGLGVVVLLHVEEFGADGVAGERTTAVGVRQLEAFLPCLACFLEGV